MADAWENPLGSREAFVTEMKAEWKALLWA